MHVAGGTVKLCGHFWKLLASYKVDVLCSHLEVSKTFHLYEIQEQSDGNQMVVTEAGSMGGLSGLMEKVLCLVLMMVTWVYMIVKTRWSENLSSLYFIMPNK